MRKAMLQLALVSVVLTASAGALAQSPGRIADGRMTWTTLGTSGGPLVQPERSQPANMLLVEGKPWLIDCGDGASERLAQAGFVPAQVDTVFISHLHIDHTGGLLGLIGLRWMTRAPHVLTIYGPPGTDTLVAGLVQALQPAQRIGIGTKGTTWTQSVADTVQVKILTDAADLLVDGVRVRAIKNSHYTDPDGQDIANGSQSMSYRFDRGGYAIGYTGDTGPSAEVARLESGVDLLVSEVIDIDAMVAEITDHYAQMPPPAKASLILHFRTQHLTPEEAGKLATAAHAKELILTHLTALGKTATFEARLTAETAKTFIGDIRVAHDLDQFKSDETNRDKTNSPATSLPR